MAAPTSSPARDKRAADRSTAYQSVVERMRATVPGKGAFLVALTDDYPNRSYPPPSNDMKDLLLQPGVAQVIDEQWLNSPLVIRDFQAGIIHLSYADNLPQQSQMDPDPETLEGLPQTMKLMVRTIVESSLTREYKDMLLLASHIKPNGLPKKDSRVTKRWLKGEYAIFLRAIATFEQVKRARPEVLSLIAEQLDRIESM